MKQLLRALSDTLIEPSRGPRRLAALKQSFGDELNEAALRRVAVSHRYGILYNRIQKNANSSLIAWFHRIEHGTTKSIIKSRRDMLHLDRVAPGQVAKIATYRRLIVIRNPYSRVLSAFLEKFRYDHIIAAHGRFERTPEGFGAFLDWVQNGGLTRNPHWDLQTKQIALPLSAYTDVIRFETLAQDMTRFIASIGNEALTEASTGMFDQGRRHATGADTRQSEYYTPARQQQVAEIYRADFEVLGYEVDRVNLQ